MIPTQKIQELADRIAAQFHPERIILFGSYAWGHPTPDSDVDLLVVLPFQGKSWRMASEIRRHARAPFPMDLLVRTPEQLRQRLTDGDTFLEEVTRQGQVLYEA
jgi:predicted nucleotidyltransferase